MERFHGEIVDACSTTSTINVEERENYDDIHDLLHDMIAGRAMDVDVGCTHVKDSNREQNHNHRIDHDKFYGLIEDAKEKLYPNCKNSQSSHL